MLLFIAMHYEIHVIGGQRSVKITPLSLPPHHSGSATRDFHSSISVETLLCGYHLDVQALLHQQLLSSAVVQYSVLLPMDQVVVLLQMNSPSSPSHRHPGVFFSLVSSLRLTTTVGDTIYHIGLFTMKQCILHLGQH